MSEDIKKPKLHPIIRIPLFLIMILVGTSIFLLIAITITDFLNSPSTTNTNSSLLSQTQSNLEFQALNQMNTFGLDYFCSAVTDRKLINVTIGTATGGQSGQTRFPAIKANFAGTCLQVQNGDPDTKIVSDYWTFFALDEASGLLRCLKVTTVDDIDQHASLCNFQPE